MLINKNSKYNDVSIYEMYSRQCKTFVIDQHKRVNKWLSKMDHITVIEKLFRALVKKKPLIS